jgi:phosphate-selective porin OprO/OprP
VLRWTLVIVSAALSWGSAVPAAAQSQTQTPQTPPASAAPNYFFPDVPAKALTVDAKSFWFRPIFAVVTDYTAFTQDDASLAQVGKQDNMSELRAGRLGGFFRWKGRLKWEFYTSVDYQESKTRENAIFQLYDLQLRIPIGPVKFAFGKQKETISYELIALSVVLPQQERILLPFFVTRNIGLNASGELAHERMTWSAGVFNDGLATGVSVDKTGTEFDGRLTGLAWESASQADYLHLGVGWRRVGPDDGKLRFAGRPESNVADKFTDTKDFVGKSAQELSLEGLLSWRRFSVLGEHFSAWVNAPDSGDPGFSGSYLLGSWFVTGESRQYVHVAGFAGAVNPKRRFGAVELVVRFSHVDLTDVLIDGGVLNKWHYGVNWWASRQWKIGLSYGNADLDRGGLHGNTRMLLTRLQWLY